MTDSKKDNFLRTNLTLINSGDFPIPAKPINRLATPIIYDPENYNLIIERFTSNTIFPLFTPIVSTFGSPDTNLIIYIAYGSGDTFSTFQRTIVISDDDRKNGIFNIGPFLDYLNIAANIAFTSMKAMFPGSTAQNQPFFALDPTTQLISMYVDDGYLIQQPLSSNSTLVLINSPLQSLLGMPFMTSPYSPIPFYPTTQDGVIIINVGSQVTATTPGSQGIALPAVNTRFGYPIGIQSFTGNMIKISQEFVQTANFDDKNKLVFTSTNLPVIKTSLAISNGPDQSSSVSDNFLPIVTDFYIGGSNERSNFIQYLPTAEFRRIGMTAGKPIDIIDMQLFNTYNDGTLIPLMVPPGGLIDILISFERKH